MNRIEEGARHRIEACQKQQMETVAAVREGMPLRAEPDVTRAMERAQVKAQLNPDTVVMERLQPLRVDDPEAGGPERIWGPTADFVGVAFLERGMNAARTVGRVAFRDGSAQGTGFLIAPGIFLTNNHVVESEAACPSFVVEFDYEIDADGRHREISRFELAPTELFVTDHRDDLDYTVVALGRRLSGPEPVESFGFTALSGASNKHTLGEVANIVQHPDGRLKEVVLRENRLVSRLSHVLHYVADTQPGSSGSPVLNNQWQAIALHHWGGPWRQRRGPDGLPVPRYVNEGIRISAIVDRLREWEPELRGNARARLQEALALGIRTEGVPVARKLGSEQPDEPRVRVREDGTAVWRVPIEIAVGVPSLGLQPPRDASLAAPGVALEPLGPAAEAFRRTVDRRYGNRRGYRERFLPDHRIPLPDFTTEVRDRLARNLEAEAGDDPFEFPYEHFSVYVDGTRGLPLVTACNIDGRRLKSINRKTGQVSDAESLAGDAQPEAREKWFEDPRIDPALCGDDRLYVGQTPAPGSGNPTSRIFHRGHMVRRLDPCWGSEASALRAEADTFHFTNATPQIGRFNSGRTLWQGIENHVLDAARVDDLRVSVFTGPVLDDADPHFRQDVFPGFRVPLRFWKIALWREEGLLSALALIADQSVVLTQLPERAEGLGDTERVDEFVTTVPEIERLTGLDFGADVRQADLHEDAGESAGESAGRKNLRRIETFEELSLAPRRASKPTRARRPRGRRKPEGR